MNNTILELEGNVNDLLFVDNKHDLKMTRLVCDNAEEPDYGETFDVSITSVDPSRTHKLFNEHFLNKRIKITIETI